MHRESKMGEKQSLPGAGEASIAPEKIRDYLLSVTHTTGRSKAAFFHRLGYFRDQWQRLEADILELARSGAAIERESTPYGRKYEVSGILRGPSGRKSVVRTVWIVGHGEDSPRLVTAYPGELR